MFGEQSHFRFQYTVVFTCRCIFGIYISQSVRESPWQYTFYVMQNESRLFGCSDLRRVSDEARVCVRPDTELEGG